MRSAYYTLEHEGVVYHVFNAETYEFDKLCKRAAYYLTGRHKPVWRPNKCDRGDMVIVANASNLRMKGDQLKYEKMQYHTGHPGGLKTKYFKEYVIKKPEFLFYYGVYKQLPKNRMRFKYMENLFVYRGPEVEYAHFLPNVS